jgi:hypothetical protein
MIFNNQYDFDVSIKIKMLNELKIRYMLNKIKYN